MTNCVPVRRRFDNITATTVDATKNTTVVATTIQIQPGTDDGDDGADGEYKLGCDEGGDTAGECREGGRAGGCRGNGGDAGSDTRSHAPSKNVSTLEAIKLTARSRFKFTERLSTKLGA